MSKSNTIKSQAYYLEKMSLYLEGSAGKITFIQSSLLKENDENKTYESVQLFKNEYDLEKFLSNKDHLTELQNAKC